MMKVALNCFLFDCWVGQYHHTLISSCYDQTPKNYFLLDSDLLMQHVQSSMHHKAQTYPEVNHPRKSVNLQSIVNGFEFITETEWMSEYLNIDFE